MWRLAWWSCRGRSCGGGEARSVSGPWRSGFGLAGTCCCRGLVEGLRVSWIVWWALFVSLWAACGLRLSVGTGVACGCSCSACGTSCGAAVTGVRDNGGAWWAVAGWGWLVLRAEGGLLLALGGWAAAGLACESGEWSLLSSSAVETSSGGADFRLGERVRVGCDGLLSDLEGFRCLSSVEAVALLIPRVGV